MSVGLREESARAWSRPSRFLQSANGCLESRGNDVDEDWRDLPFPEGGILRIVVIEWTVVVRRWSRYFHERRVKKCSQDFHFDLARK